MRVVRRNLPGGVSDGGGWLAEAYREEVPAGAEDSAVEAQDNCPVSVITVE
jgi:ferredoxin